MALSLNLMDRTVQVMRDHVVDDVHLSNRFSNFLEVITNRLRPMIVRMSRTTGASSANAANSRVSSRPASPGSALQNRTTEHMPAFPTDGFADQQQAQQGNRDASANANAQALYGIPTQTYDISDGNNAFSIMPPPTEVFNHQQNPLSASDTHDPQDFYSAYGDATGFMGADDGYDWLALPLDPILQAGGDITASSFGPGIGEFDMLEVLLGGGGGQQHGH